MGGTPRRGQLGRGNGRSLHAAPARALRRRLAEPFCLVALAAIAVYFAGLSLNSQLRDLLTSDQIAVALVAVIVAWTIFSFARHSRQRGWLR